MFYMPASQKNRVLTEREQVTALVLHPFPSFFWFLCVCELHKG